MSQLVAALWAEPGTVCWFRQPLTLCLVLIVVRLVPASGKVCRSAAKAAFDTLCSPITGMQRASARCIV